ncbi:Trm112 family protein [Candidatus Woesearchaeota archaeon]|nr:MAG: Trm112 family protein [Candidatus Woesearchaeota archaeon]
MAEIPKKLFQILACPICKGDLVYNETKTGLICKNCSVWYEIKEGIPVLLKEKAKKC